MTINSGKLSELCIRDLPFGVNSRDMLTEEEIEVQNKFQREFEDHFKLIQLEYDVNKQRLG
jgi:hypothetical protein